MNEVRRSRPYSEDDVPSFATPVTSRKTKAIIATPKPRRKKTDHTFGTSTATATAAQGITITTCKVGDTMATNPSVNGTGASLIPIVPTSSIVAVPPATSTNSSSTGTSNTTSTFTISSTPASATAASPNENTERREKGLQNSWTSQSPEFMTPLPNDLSQPTPGVPVAAAASHSPEATTPRKKPSLPSTSTKKRKQPPAADSTTKSPPAKQKVARTKKGSSTETDSSTSKKKRTCILCQIPGCPRLVTSKGYCKPHINNPDLEVDSPINDEDQELERYTGVGKRSSKSKGHNRVYKRKRPDPFLIYYPQLVKYKEEHGDIDVPRKNRGLYDFLVASRQKYMYTTHEGKMSRTLTPERIEQLSALGMEWERPKVEDDWEDNFQLLVDFNAQHGHCRVNTARAELALANFVKRTRSNHAQHMTSKEKGTLTPERPRMLTPDRIKRLDELGFEWKVWTQDPWEKRFLEVQDFKAKHGHFCVRFTENQTLSSWVKTQRTSYRNFMNKLSAENDMKMAARSAPEGKAPEALDKAYALAAKKRPMLDADRIVRLQMIGFEWNVQENHYEGAWEKHFMELLEFKAENGHTRVSRNYQENPKLGTWVKMQRRAMTKKIKGTGGDSLSDERIRRLDDIGFEWRLKPLEVDD